MNALSIEVAICTHFYIASFLLLRLDQMPLAIFSLFYLLANNYYA